MNNQKPRKLVAFSLMFLLLLNGVSVPAAAANTGILTNQLLPGNNATSGQANTNKLNVEKDEDGNTTFISGKVTAAKVKSFDDAIKLLEENKNYFKIKSAKSEFVLKQDVQSNKLGNTYKLKQVYKGVPVFGKELIVNTKKDGSVRSINGDYDAVAQTKTIQTKPRLTSAKSIETAKKEVGLENVQNFRVSTSELVILPLENNYYLAYSVKLSTLEGETPSYWQLFVDAQSGKVLKKYSLLTHASADGKGVNSRAQEVDLKVDYNKSKKIHSLIDTSKPEMAEVNSKIETFTANNAEEIETAKTVTSKTNRFTDGAAVDAHVNAGKVYDYFQDNYGRNSYDGNGASIKSIVHFGENYSNAFWDGAEMVYGDGDGEEFEYPFSAGLDVVAHEITHAVTEHSASLTYWGQSGALNESFSDVFGNLIEDESDAEWPLGEDLSDDGSSIIRSMQDPALYGQPAHMSEYENTQDDNGGVHINSGIPNKAFYNLVTTDGITKEIAGNIWYAALTSYLTEESTFRDARLATIEAANGLYSSSDPTVAQKVSDAWTNVGIYDINDNLQDLQIGTPLTDITLNANDEKWFKVTPLEGQVMPFMNVEATCANSDGTNCINYESAEISIEIYSNFENANQNSTNYYSSGYGNIESSMPMAWTGPYYVKLSTETGGKFTIEANGLDKAPEYAPVMDPCLFEVAVSQDAKGTGLLEKLRVIRDQVLNNSSEGRTISSTYYNLSPYLVKEYMLNSEFRELLKSDLQQLEPLTLGLYQFALNGKTSYVFTKEDINTMAKLKEAVYEVVPESTKEKMQDIWSELNLENAQGKQLSSVLENSGLASVTNNDEYAGNEAIVKFKNGVSADQAKKELVKLTEGAFGKNAILAVSSVASFDKSVALENTFLVKLNSGFDPKEVVSAVSKSSSLSYAQVNHVYKALQTNDANYKYQWGLENVDVADTDIKFNTIETQLKGKTMTTSKIAVIDTGINDELKDFEGVVNLDLGKDFVNQTNDPWDDNNHGTHVSGVIAAKANNMYSMTGINQHTEIIPIKVLDSLGEGSDVNVALGIKYAVKSGADVINLSLGGGYSELIEDALKYAVQNDVTVIAAAGNDGMDGISYPASSDYAISVGSTNETGSISSFSNYGEGLDIVAPGEKIASLIADGNVSYMDGTSMATPHVAAIAGLLYSIHPNVTPGEIAEILKVSTDDLGAEGYDTLFGYGRLNAEKALQAALPALVVNEVTETSTAVTGKAIANSDISVSVENGGLLGEGIANADGKFSVVISKQKAETNLVVTAGDESKTVKVKQYTGPMVPEVDVVHERDRVITGTAEPQDKINVYAETCTRNGCKDALIGSAKADNEGNYSVAISQYKKYLIYGNFIKVSAYNQTYRKESPKTETMIQPYQGPPQAKVDEVWDTNKQVTGIADLDSNVIIKNGETVIGEAKTPANGKFVVKLSSTLAAGTTLDIVVEDIFTQMQSTIQTTVKETPAPATIRITVPDQVKANESIEIKGNVLDQFRKAISTKLTLKWGTTNKSITTNKDGSFVLKVNAPKLAGESEITVNDQVRQSVVSSTPVTVIPSDVQKITLVSVKTATANNPVTITGTVTDAYGNKIGSQGLEVTIKLGSKMVGTPASVSSDTAGQFIYGFTPETKGSYTVRVAAVGTKIYAVQTIKVN